MIKLGESFNKLPLLFIYSRKIQHITNLKTKSDTYITQIPKRLKTHFKHQL